MLGKTYINLQKKHNVGEVIFTEMGHQYRIIKTLGTAFRDGRKVFYKYEIEFVEFEKD